VGLAELFVAVLVVGISCVNAAVPIAAYLRSKDGRFLALSAASVGLALVGLLWTWGQLPLSPPSWTSASLPIMVLVLLATVLLLAASTWPRHV
jgi:hypothetical protein